MDINTISNISSLIDIIILAIIGISIIVAFFRGLITEVLSLFVWIGAFIGATKYFKDVALLLPNIFGGNATSNLAGSVNPENMNEMVIASVVSFVITFLGILFILGLINLVISILIRRLKITWPDRFLGAFFGLLRGIFVVAVIALFIIKSPLKDHEAWKKAQLTAPATSWANRLSQFLPDDFLASINTDKLIADMQIPLPFGNNNQQQNGKNHEEIEQLPPPTVIEPIKATNTTEE